MIVYQKGRCGSLLINWYLKMADTSGCLAFIRYFSKVQASVFSDKTDVPMLMFFHLIGSHGSHTVLAILQWWKVKDLHSFKHGTDGRDCQKHSWLAAFRKISLVLGMWNALLITRSLFQPAGSVWVVLSPQTPRVHFQHQCSKASPMEPKGWLLNCRKLASWVRRFNFPQLLHDALHHLTSMDP